MKTQLNLPHNQCVLWLPLAASIRQPHPPPPEDAAPADDPDTRLTPVSHKPPQNTCLFWPSILHVGEVGLHKALWRLLSRSWLACGARDACCWVKYAVVRCVLSASLYLRIASQTLHQACCIHSKTCCMCQWPLADPVPTPASSGRDEDARPKPYPNKH